MFFYQMCCDERMSSVVPCCVCVPYVYEDAWEGFACFDIYYAYVEELGGI